LNILFTSVGRRVELIQAFHRAIKNLQANVRIIGTDIDPLAPALPYLDDHYIVPPYDDEQFIQTLIEICERYDGLYVFPLIDPDILILAQNRDLLEKTDAKVVVIDENKAQTTTDKLKTYQFLQSNGIPVPKTYKSFNEISKNEYPVFIKPRTGSAAKSTFKVKNREELEFYLQKIPKPIIQEFLPGPEITNDVICDFDRNILGVVSRQRIEVRWGEVAKGKTIYNKEITKYCVKIANALNAIGPITVQCILKGGKPHFTEINARYGGGAPLGIAAGVDSPKWLLSKLLDIVVEIPPIGHYLADLYLTRYDTSSFLTQSEYDKIASHHL